MQERTMTHHISPGTAALLQGMADDVLGTLTSEEASTWRHEDLVGAAIDLVGTGHDSRASWELAELLGVLGYDKLVALASPCVAMVFELEEEKGAPDL
jgi:hypothetical protein